MISPTTEHFGSSLPSTPTSTSRPTIFSSTIILRSNWNASTNASSSSSRFLHLLIPTLEPRFAGFTKQGYPNLSSTLE